MTPDDQPQKSCPRLACRVGGIVCRKAFTPLEAVALGERLEQLEKPAAKVRQGERKGISEKQLGGKLPRSSEKTRDKVGESAGLAGKAYEKAKAVAKSGDQDEAIAGLPPTRSARGLPGLRQTANGCSSLQHVAVREAVRHARIIPCQQLPLFGEMMRQTLARLARLEEKITSTKKIAPAAESSFSAISEAELAEIHEELRRMTDLRDSDGNRGQRGS